MIILQKKKKKSCPVLFLNHYRHKKNKRLINVIIFVNKFGTGDWDIFLPLQQLLSDNKYFVEQSFIFTHIFSTSLHSQISKININKGGGGSPAITMSPTISAPTILNFTKCIINFIFINCSITLIIIPLIIKFGGTAWFNGICIYSWC